jgi:lysophospholipid acyltransferase (LPLAT)-like uncharacterized protein
VAGRSGQKQKNLKIEGWRARCLVAIGFWLLRTWERTLRYQVDDRANLLARAGGAGAIGTVWHNRLLVMPLVLKRFLSHRQGAALISASRDGAWIAALVQRSGFDVVRGSSSRLGATAMLQMAELLAHGRDVVISPDGPRGPVYEMAPGIVLLAQKSGAPVFPLNLEYSGCWRVKSWDRFILPHPFSKVRVIFGPPHQVAATKTEEEFETERLRLQNAMMALVERR